MHNFGDRYKYRGLDPYSHKGRELLIILEATGEQVFRRVIRTFNPPSGVVNLRPVLRHWIDVCKEKVANDDGMYDNDKDYRDGDRDRKKRRGRSRKHRTRSS